MMAIADVPPLWSDPLALFLDVDGTLAPLAERPEYVRIAPETLRLLLELQRLLDGALALISGRPLVELDALFTPLQLPAAGVHGAQRRDAAGRVRMHAGAPPPAAVAIAHEWVERYPGLRLEIKPAAFALHYRALPAMGAPAAHALQAALQDDPDWEAMEGHCVVEVKPRSVSKGRALRAFLAEVPFDGRMPVFIGDDVTDEQAFAAAQGLGGFGVKVGAGPTQAAHRLPDPPAVLGWLAQLARHRARR